MATKAAALSFSLVFLVFIQCSTAQSGMERVIEKCEDKGLRESLENFRLNGIEKQLILDGAEPSQLIEKAKQYLNAPHRIGGISKKGMDCSGLIYRAFKDLGVEIPHRSLDQARYGEVIATKSSLRSGDLVFFRPSYKSKRLINHVGIYVGNSEFIHVSSSAGCTIISLNDRHWRALYLFGTRVFLN